MKIGSLSIDTPLFLGPMAGVTDLPFRLLCVSQGCGVCCTEMVSAKALYYGNKGTGELLQRADGDGLTAVQLFGSDPQLMAQMAERIQDDFDMIDINMGCPVPKVVNNGEGSALMKQPELVGEIISAMTRRLHKPVTVTIRKGFDESHVNAVEIAKIAEQAGAAAIAVHGRTRALYYSGKADWSIIREVKQAVRIPVIGNGDIFTGADACRMLAQTGCDGVMIARGAQGNPWLFAEVRAALEGRPAPERPSRAEIATMIRRHAELMLRCKRETVAMRELRKHLAWYTAGCAYGAKLRARACLVSTERELEEWLEDFCAGRAPWQDSPCLSAYLQ